MAAAMHIASTRATEKIAVRAAVFAFEAINDTAGSGIGTNTNPEPSQCEDSTKGTASSGVLGSDDWRISGT
ncbi:MAG: hypothetical protein M3Y72_15895 [Acidobacteriota bacterium]|nr:hypothetical protein [Acidobacteriota bacterium]